MKYLLICICWLLAVQVCNNTLERRHKCGSGFTQLHCAIIHNEEPEEEVKRLLDDGANPNTLSENGYSPLMSAAKIGSERTIQLLLDWKSPDGERVDVAKAVKDGNTALHIASEHAHVDVVNMLAPVEEGNLKKLNKDGDTPLHLASRRGHVSTVQALLNHGAKLNIKNKEGKTPKQLAVDGDHFETESVLAAHERQYKDSSKQEHPQSFKTIDETLWNACLENKGNEIDRLLNEEANPYWRKKQHNDFDCLKIAVYHENIEGVDILLRHSTHAMESALHFASSYGRVEAVKRIIDAGTNVNAVDMITDDTPLHNAAAYGHLEVVKLLVERGAALDLKNKEGKTPLDVAKKKKQVIAVVKYLEEQAHNHGKPENQGACKFADEETLHDQNSVSGNLLKRPPEISVHELLERVASKAMNKWRLVGTALELEQDQLKAITCEDPRSCYSEVFDLWQKKGDPPFTWETIIKRLKSGTVGLVKLATEIEKWLEEFKTLD